MLKLILIREGRKNIITNIRRKTKYVIGREKLSKTEKLQRYAKCRRNLIPRFLVNKLIKLATMYVSRFKICHTFDYKRKKKHKPLYAVEYRHNWDQNICTLSYPKYQNNIKKRYFSIPKQILQVLRLYDNIYPKKKN